MRRQAVLCPATRLLTRLGPLLISWLKTPLNSTNLVDSFTHPQITEGAVPRRGSFVPDKGTPCAEAAPGFPIYRCFGGAVLYAAKLDAERAFTSGEYGSAIKKLQALLESQQFE